MFDVSSGRGFIVVSWMYRMLFGGFCLAGAVTLFATMASPTGLVGGFLGAPFFIISILALRGARVEFGSDDVVVKSTWRTRRIPRDDVAAVGITSGSNAAGIAWRVPYFRLRDGTWVIAQEIRSLRKGTVVDRVVDFGQQWVCSEHPPPGDVQ